MAFGPDAQRREIEWKNRHLIFVGYCEDVEAYRLFDPNSIEVLFRQDVQFDESLPVVDTLPLESTSLTTTFSSFPVSFSNDEDDDLGDPHLPPPQDPPQMPKWARVTVEAAGSLVGDPFTSHHTWSHIASSNLLSHVICNDPHTFVAAIGHSEWDSAMEEEYSSLMKNHTWDLCPLSKGINLV